MNNGVGKFLKRHARHWLFRYGLAVFLFALTLGLSTLFSRIGLSINLTVPLIVSIVAAAWYGGRGPGLLISVLFQGATLLLANTAANQSPLYRWSLHASVFGLYVFLTFVISGLRQAQLRLRESRDTLRVTLTSIGDGVVATDLKGNITFMNPVAKRLTGWGDSAVGQPLTSVMPIINEDSRERVDDPVSKVLATGTVVGLANHSVLIAKDGREIPIEDSAAPIMQDGKVQGVVMVFSDVSARKATERVSRENALMHGIVEAQESERRRIARDLHDHLGQRMTALRLRVEAVAKECGKYKEIEDALKEIQAAASEIDRDVAFLSWELRPTELENLGLDDAIASYVREWSRQHGISADFHAAANNGTILTKRLQREMETNVYRIVQEALNNIVKHAEAESVSVLLQYGSDNLTLIVEDDGRGFTEDIHTTGAGPQSGLGLIGMRERTEILGGSLSIESTTSGGTTVIARIPTTASTSKAAVA